MQCYWLTDSLDQESWVGDRKVVGSNPTIVTTSHCWLSVSLNLPVDTSVFLFLSLRDEATEILPRWRQVIMMSCILGLVVRR